MLAGTSPECAGATGVDVPADTLSTSGAAELVDGFGGKDRRRAVAGTDALLGGGGFSPPPDPRALVGSSCERTPAGGSGGVPASRDGTTPG